MSDDKEPNFTTPPEDFEIIEIDTDAHLTAEQKTWPVADLVQEEDFAIEDVTELPALVLTVSECGTDPLSAAVEAASDCEAGLGGSGLDERGRWVGDGVTTLTLVPRTLDGARERLARVARIAAGFAGVRSASVA